MLKKFVFIVLAIFGALILTPGFRQGYKEGFNKTVDDYNRTHLDQHPLTSKKFKNV